jgi:hypothetical protein
MPSPSDLLKRLSPRSRKRARGVRDAWGAVRDFIEALGVAGIFGLIAWEKIYGVLRDCAPFMPIAALIGLSSPVTGAYGITWISASTAATWFPVALPVTVLAVWLLWLTIEQLREETKREAGRQKRERRRPDLYRLLAKQQRDRVELNAPYELVKGLPKLETINRVADHLTELVQRIQDVYGITDFAVALLRRHEKSGFQVHLDKGGMDDRVKERLGLGTIDERQIGQALNAALDPLQYRHREFPFGAGPRSYVLVGVSGATIPDDVRLELSETATLLVEEFVWTAHKPERKRKDA